MGDQNEPLMVFIYLIILLDLLLYLLDDCAEAVYSVISRSQT